MKVLYYKISSILHIMLISFKTTDTGTLYCVFSLVAGVIGIFYSILIRSLLLKSATIVNFFSVDSQFLNILVIVQAFIIVFYAVVPLLFFGLSFFYFVKILGVSKMAIPCLDKISFYLLVFSFVCLNLGL